MLVESTRDDLHGLALNEVTDDPEQLVALGTRQATLGDDGSDALAKLVASLFPLILH